MSIGVTTRRPSTPGEDPATDEPVGDRQDPPGQTHHGVVIDLGVLVAVPEQLDRRVDQQQAEHEEHEGEQCQQRGSECDEHRPHGQGEHDAERQHLVLMLDRYREGRDDDDEDEEVVDGQALLHQVADEVLGAELAAVSQGEPHAEDQGHRDVEDRPRGRLPEPDAVRLQRGDGQVCGEQGHDDGDRDDPSGKADVEHVSPFVLGSGLRRWALPTVASVMSDRGVRSRIAPVAERGVGADPTVVSGVAAAMRTPLASVDDGEGL